MVAAGKVPKRSVDTPLDPAMCNHLDNPSHLILSRLLIEAKDLVGSKTSLSLSKNVAHKKTSVKNYLMSIIQTYFSMKLALFYLSVCLLRSKIHRKEFRRIAQCAIAEVR